MAEFASTGFTSGGSTRTGGLTRPDGLSRPPLKQSPPVGYGGEAGTGTLAGLPNLTGIDDAQKPKVLVDAYWDAVAKGQDPSQIMEALIGLSIPTNDNAPGSVTAYQNLLLHLTPDELEALKGTHPEISEAIDATLAIYDEVKVNWDYMLYQHQISLGIVQAPYGTAPPSQGGGLGPGSVGGPAGGGGGTGGGVAPGAPGAGGGATNPTILLAQSLAAMGIDAAPIMDLLDKAVRENWSTEVLLGAIYTDPRFQAQFPGITTLTSQGIPMGQALDQWRQLKFAYTQAVFDQGASNIVNVDNQLIGLAIQNGKSPEEFGALVKGVKMFHDDPGFADFLNEIVSQGNLQPLSQTGVIEFLAGLAEPEVYDTYEAFYASQVGMDSATARQFARALGVAGQQTNLAALPEALMAFDDAAGQELRMAGFTKDDMVLVATRDQLSGEFRERADKLAIAFEQAFKNRAARSSPRPQGQMATVAGRPVSGEAPALASIG